MHKRIPIGVDDFKKIRETYYFVDKTDFIRQLIDVHSEVTLLTRPRRFGKTLTMSMLKYFFTIDHAVENSELFRGLSIDNAGEEYMKEQGKYPVVLLSLKGCKALSWDEAYEKLKYSIIALFDEFNYLQNSDQITVVERQNFTEIISGKESNIYGQSLELLTRLLYKHHGVKPILLIDEYDVPIQYGWENGYYEQVMMFVKNWLSAALKTNAFLNFAILTGVLRVSKESIFSDLNNLDVCSVMTEKYNGVLGFTPDEVERLMLDFGAVDKLPEIKEWYDGYNFAGQEMYNPWSVLKYIDAKCRPQAYWVNTSGNSLLKSILQSNHQAHGRNLLALMEGKNVVATIREGVIYSDIHQDKDALYTMLVTTGYLKVIEEKSSDGLSCLCTVAIPNREIRAAYRFEILDKVRSRLEVSDLLMLMENLLAGETESFEEGLQRYLLEVVSVYDVANKESFYHGLMLGMVALLIPTYQIQSNRESGYGRFDLAIFPQDVTKKGVVLEFKATDQEALLESQAKRALAQIEEKVYIAEFQARGVRSVLKYGIAFCGKTVRIVKNLN